MPTLKVGGINVQYTAFPELGKAVERAIGKLDTRLKRINEERRKVARQQRALKGFLGGKEKKPAAHIGHAEPAVA